MYYDIADFSMQRRKGCLESTFSRNVVRLAPSSRFNDTNTAHLEKHTTLAERFILAVLSTCTSHFLHRTAAHKNHDFYCTKSLSIP